MSEEWVFTTLDVAASAAQFGPPLAVGQLGELRVEVRDSMPPAWVVFDGNRLVAGGTYAVNTGRFPWITRAAVIESERGRGVFRATLKFFVSRFGGVESDDKMAPAAAAAYESLGAEVTTRDGVPVYRLVSDEDERAKLRANPDPPHTGLTTRPTQGGERAAERDLDPDHVGLVGEEMVTGTPYWVEIYKHHPGEYSWTVRHAYRGSVWPFTAATDPSTKEEALDQALRAIARGLGDPIYNNPPLNEKAKLKANTGGKKANPGRAPIEDFVPTHGVERVGVDRAKAMLRDGWDTSVVPPVTVIVTTVGSFLPDQEEPREKVFFNKLEVRDGHHRLAAARELGIKSVPYYNYMAMSRGERGAYTRAIRKYRKLSGHPLATNPPPGKTFTAYHASTSGMVDKPSEFRSSRGMDYGPGFYLGTDPRDLSLYGDRLYEATVRLDNPIVISHDEPADQELLDWMKRALRIDDEMWADMLEDYPHPMVGVFATALTLMQMGEISPKKLIAALQKRGYDGVYVDGQIVNEHQNMDLKGDYLTVWSPEQLLSWEERRPWEAEELRAPRDFADIEDESGDGW